MAGDRPLRQETMDEVILRCPDCRGVLAAHPIAGVRLYACAECGGLWADAEALGRIHREAAVQAAVLRLAPPRTPRAAAAGPRLCPRCAAKGLAELALAALFD
jgi:Zn-finger nucleic acid-binding protein